MKKILYILKHNPWGVGGGCKASEIYLSAFLKVFPSHHFDVLICDYCLEQDHRDYGEKCKFVPVPPRGWYKVFSVVNGIMHRYQNKAKEMLAVNDYEYCIFDHSQIAGTLLSFVGKGTKTIVLHHNFEQKYSRDNTTSYIHKCCFLHFVAEWEKLAFLNCTYNVFLTKEDLDEFRDTYGREQGKSIVGGIFDNNYATQHESCANPAKSKLTGVITGSLGNVQNVDGLRYFFEELYPLLPSEMKLIVAGKNPSEVVYVLACDKKNVTIVPNPPSMQTVIEQGTIYLCPTRLGSGIKVRVTDGLRAGLPVVAHKVSARGYSDFVEKGYLCSFETKEEFIGGLKKIIGKVNSNPGFCQDICKYYADTHSFASGVGRLRDGILEKH